MLILNRKVGERIFIGDDIVVTVVYTDRGRARLGIDAPKGTPIFREEVLPADDPRRKRAEAE